MGLLAGTEPFFHRGGRTGVYEVRIANPAGELVALFKGTAYQTSKTIDVQ